MNFLVRGRFSGFDFLFFDLLAVYIPFFSLDAQIPDWFGGESSGSTKGNPFPLPDVYLIAQQRNVCPLNHAELKCFIVIILPRLVVYQSAVIR